MTPTPSARARHPMAALDPDRLRHARVAPHHVPQAPAALHAPQGA